jgi:putative transposase
VPAETRSKISTSPDTFVYTIAELIRKVGISEQTFYRWKSKYVGLEVDQIRQLKQLRDENTRLKQLVAELTLDKTMLQDVLRKRL